MLMYISDISSSKETMSQTINDNLITSGILSRLLINYGQIQDISLMSGKMGGVLFFMAYARKTGISAYCDFCDELLDDIYNHIHQGMPIGLFEGLTGIGWGIEYLLKNGYADGAVDEILNDIDNLVVEHDPQRMTDLSLESGLGGVLFYVNSRLQYGENRSLNTPFDLSYIASLSKAIHRPSFLDISSCNSMVKDYDSIIQGRLDNEQKCMCIPDFMFEGVPDNLENLQNLPIGIKRGLTGYALRMILK